MVKNQEWISSSKCDETVFSLPEMRKVNHQFANYPEPEATPDLPDCGIPDFDPYTPTVHLSISEDSEISGGAVLGRYCVHQLSPASMHMGS
jgi:hypothetical protein